jgi:hypothetical protein
MPIGLAGTRGQDASGPIYPTTAQLVGEMAATVADFGDSGATVVMLQPMPQYARWTPWTPDTCLAAASRVTSCEYPIERTEVWEPNLWGAEQRLARAGRLKLIETQRLFCASKCVLFVHAGTQYRLVFSDDDHMLNFYSAWIGRALAQLLSPVLRAAA